MKSLSVIFILLGVLFSFTSVGFALANTGTIDSVYKYAWSNQIGWINFAPTDRTGNYVGLTITDSAITGYAWSQNFGWINFNPTNGGVTNDGHGFLSGSAFGENTGWINFGGVKICSGQFSGSATGDIVGTINFSCSNCLVKTNWLPAVSGCGVSLGGAITVNKKAIGDDGTFTFIAQGHHYSNFSITTLQGSGSNTQTNLEPGTYSVSETVPSGWTKTEDTCGAITVVDGQTATCSVTNVKDTTEIPPPPPPPPPPPSLLPPPPPTTPSAATPPTAETPTTTPLNTTNSMVAVVTKTRDFIKGIIQTKQGSIVTKVISTIGVVGGAVTTASVIVSSYSFYEIFLMVIRLLGSALTALGIKKRIVPWGIAYDSVTKQPLDPAYIILQDLQGTYITSAITDIDGRYGFLVKPDTYRLIARKTNYAFPSKKMVGKIEDEIYNNLYFGEALEIKKTGQVITKNIPLDPVTFDWNEFAKKNKNFMKFYSRWDLLIKKVSDIFFAIGFIVAIVAFFFVPRPYNIIILLLYLFLSLLRIVGIKPKAFGYVIDKTTGMPLSFAILRIMAPYSNLEISHKISDAYGRYYCLLPRGQYYVKIEKKNSDGSYSLVYTSPIIDAFKKGIIRKKFEV